MDKKNDNIEKGKWQIGMTRDWQGKTYVVSKFNPQGRPLWKLVKDGGKGDGDTDKSSADGFKQAPDVSKNPSASTATSTPTPTPTPKPKQAVSYDAPTPKVVYKNRPAKEIEEMAQVPEEFTVKNLKTGKLEKKQRSAYRKAYADKNIMTDDKLLNIINRANLPWEFRTIAWEEAQARGIGEDKIDVTGSLGSHWKALKREYDFANPPESDDTDEGNFASTSDAIFNTFDYDKIRAEFPEGDTGWEDPDDKRIQKNFNGLSTKMDRRKYDAFVDKTKRAGRFYEPPTEVLKRLGREMLGFVLDESPLFISSGGAGAGKSTKFREMADSMELKEYVEPNAAKGIKGTGEDEYDYVVVPKDIDNEKDFAALLHKHNGKIIVFDDKDKLLVSDANKLVGMMKALADSNPKNRKFEHAGEEEKFTGKLLFITNKNGETLAKDEDHKAILSRAMHNDIHFTNAENLELLRDRYKTMGKLPSLADDPDTEKKIRQEVYDLIMEQADQLDPMKFTVRRFEEILKKVNADIESAKAGKRSASLKNALGTGKLNLEAIVDRELNKAEEASPISEEVAKMSDKLKEQYKRLYKKDPKKFIEIFGKDIIDLINEEGEYAKEDSEEDVTKSFEDEIGRMSLDVAEELLLG